MIIYKDRMLLKPCKASKRSNVWLLTQILEPAFAHDRSNDGLSSLMVDCFLFYRETCSHALYKISWFVKKRYIRSISPQQKHKPGGAQKLITNIRHMCVLVSGVSMSFIKPMGKNNKQCK